MNAEPLSPGLVILGAGFHAKVVIETIRLAGLGPVLAVLDDAPAKHGTAIHGVPVRGALGLLPEWHARGLVLGVALGMGNIRLRDKAAALMRWAAGLGVDAPPIVHPAAFIAPSVARPRGLFAGPGVVVNTDSQLGGNLTIYSGTSLDHDNVIGDDVFISPGVHSAGKVRIGAGAYIGPGAILGSAVRIGAGAIVGAGAVVLKDVPDRCLVVGAPARVARTVDEWEKAHP
ncbi:MAG TPA: NeuD/PglB/VioB family sugar acetyltransferase [Kiritimatiellia bacterium]|nr:NeuD/PglB/VioB family sugar acetyltransferase [Kiritimatiellia bacterium]HRZ11506.1 NeuD/PglB/VioB family sugar acetyltransferase [Kiritimatiellia bacterium]HSA16943.1 NeuD/PglB/VioB family sugar acetyltransferase [Kiritimatiellia bacterium]